MELFEVRLHYLLVFAGARIEKESCVNHRQGRRLLFREVLNDLSIVLAHLEYGILRFWSEASLIYWNMNLGSSFLACDECNCDSFVHDLNTTCLAVIATMLQKWYGHLNVDPSLLSKWPLSTVAKREGTIAQKGIHRRENYTSL